MEDKVVTFPSKDTESLEEVVKAAAEAADKNEDISRLRNIMNSVSDPSPRLKTYDGLKVDHGENEDISHLRETIESKPEVINHDPTMTSEVATFRVREDGKPDLSSPVVGNGELKEADLGIDEIDKLDEVNEKNTEESVKNNPMFDLTDEEALNISQIIIEYKQSRNKTHFPAYSKMIRSMQSKINALCLQMGTPLQEAPLVARYVVEQFYNNASASQEFIDIEKSIERVMKIPSMVDIYVEHANETIDKKLPALAEKYAERDPEKAAMLLKVRDQYNSAFLFDRLRQFYDTNASIRKAVRKNWDHKDVARLAANANYYNSMTKFKMPDCTAIPGIIANMMEIRGYSKQDPTNLMMINKFCVLMFASAPYLDLHDLLDASFYYYMIKNISMLAYVGEKLSDFSEELISNINITIGYIAYREAESQHANQSNKHKPKRSQRHSKH